MKQQLRALRQFLQPHARTIQLAASYLLIIMVMSISFSAVIYHTSAREIGRQLPPKSMYNQYISNDSDPFLEFLEARISAGRHELFIRLLLLNLFVLGVGAMISYILARRTLEPIEEALEAQSRFASDASHELRTPLASIQAENEVALRNTRLTLARAKELLASNLEEVTHLQRLSDGLLHLARQESYTVKTEPISLSDITQECINHSLRSAEGKHISIEDNVRDTMVYANASGLEQIINILLDNAIKYSPEHSTITLSSGTSGKEGSVQIHDQGPGISPKDLPHIFERFYRADPARSSQQVSGHGLGLALAEKLITQQDGRIDVKTKPGSGATFTVVLPLA